ncbi:MAG: hypothetical protein ACSHX8_07345 [Opitutaceae bacterium]
MRLTDDGVIVHSPHGEVILRRTKHGITAKYHSGPLINGTASAFADKVKICALNHALEIDLPWSTNANGSIIIHNHKQFYNQTFCPSTYALETLKRWSQNRLAEVDLQIRD